MTIINIFISISLYVLGGIIFLTFGIFLLLFGLISRKLLFKYIPFFCKLLLYSLGVRVVCDNKFPDKENYVIMCNHSSFIDVFIFPCFINGYFTAISAKENFKIPLFGSMLRLINAIPIDRNNNKSAIESVTNAEKFMTESGFSVVILPEGTRTLDGKLQKFKKGGFHMAKNTNMSIVPIVSYGAFNYKPKNRFTIRPGIVKVKIGSPITTKGKTIDELINKTTDIMKQLIEELKC